VIAQSRFHRRSDAQCLMNATEVVKGHVKRNSRLEIVQLFAEGIGQAGKTRKCITPDFLLLRWRYVL
jgi:hypothetical protein